MLRFGFMFNKRVFCDIALAVRGPEAAVLDHVCLHFIPGVGFNVFVESSSEDLLAVWGRYSEGYRDFFICNIFTKQWLRLPTPPFGDEGGPCALVYKPVDDNNNYSQRSSYRILQSGHEFAYEVNGDDTVFYLTIFSSETGQWSEPTLGPRLFHGMDMVSGNGMVFWLDTERKGVAALDPFRSHHNPKFYTFFEYPDDLATEETLYHGLPVEIGPRWENLYFGSRKDTLHIGVVKGRLRLSQVLRVRGVGFVLKLWELNYGNGSSDQYVSTKLKFWVLVHQVRLKAEVGTNWMYVLSFHPDDGNVIFLLRDTDLYRYEVERDRYAKSLLEFPEKIATKESLMKCSLLSYLPYL